MKGKLKRRKWYNTSRTKPDVDCGLIVMTDMGYIFEAIYEDGVYKTSFVNNHKVYFSAYSNQDSLVKFMKV